MIRILLKIKLLVLLMLLYPQGCKDQKNQVKGDASSAKQGSINTDTLDSLSRYPEPQTQEEADNSGRTIETTSEEDDLNVILPQCGILDFNDSKAKTFETVMNETYTRVIDSGIAVANVDITSSLDLKGTLSEQTLDVSVTHARSVGTSVLGPVTDIEPINARAEAIGQKFRGPVTAFTAANGSVFSKDWKGIVCTVRSSDRQINLRSGFSTEAKYSPAFVPAISPIADRARYEKELGEFRYFKNIKATVTATTNPLLTVGKVYTGSMLVEKVTAERDTPAGPMKGDSAYRVTNHFMSDEITLALGFHLWTEYYIDHGQRAFSGIITHVGDEQLRYFMGTYKGQSDKPTLVVSYTKDIKPLLTQHCVSCHSSSSSTRADLTSYAAAKIVGQALVGRVLGGSMPPSGSLSTAHKQIFQAWSQTGFPEN